MPVVMLITMTALLMMRSDRGRVGDGERDRERKEEGEKAKGREDGNSMDENSHKTASRESE